MKLTDPISGKVAYCELDDIRSAVVVNEKGKKSVTLCINGESVFLDYTESENLEEFNALVKDLELKFA